MANILEPIKKY